MSVPQIIAAIAILAMAAVLFFSYRTIVARNSERRMRAMLEAVGLDPEIAASGEMPTIMSEVRARCRACSSVSVCERWLAGETGGDNDFCPNAKVFAILGKYDKPTA